jgi:hypothetical protein
VSALTWAALGFFLFVLVFGSAAVGGFGLVFWRQLRASAAVGSQVIGDLAAAMEALDARLVGVEGHSGELGHAATRLSGSVARARILLAAAQESREAISGWLRFLPRA